MSGLRGRLTAGPVYYGWIVTASCFAGLLAIYSINFSFGVFLDFIVADMDATRATASMAFSLQTVTLYLSSAVVGTLVGRFGPRRLTLLGAILLGVGMVGATQATSLAVLLLTYGIITGAGMGIIYVISFSLPSRWFGRRRGLATAFATSGSGIATLLAPPAAAAAIAFIGWQETYLGLTLVALVVLGIVGYFIASDPWTLGVDSTHEFPHHSSITDGDADSNTTSPSTDEGTSPGPSNEPDRVSNPDCSADSPSTRSRVDDATPSSSNSNSTSEVIRSRSFLLIMLSWMVVFMPFFTLIVHFVAYATDIGMARWVGILAISLVGGLSILGRFFFGALGDRFGRPASFVSLSLAIGVLILALSVATVEPVLLAIAALYGLAHGGVGTLLTPLIADFYGEERVTALYGVSALSLAVPALVGPALAGFTVETFGSYVPFLVGSAILVLVGAGCVHLASVIEDIDTRLGTPLN